MNILSKWFFYVLVVGAIGALIGLILVFTLNDKIVPVVVLIISVLLVILGIVFWFIEAKKPEEIVEEKTNSMKNIIGKVPVIGDTMSESYVQFKEQGVPAVSQTLKGAVSYTSKNTSWGRALTFS